MLTQIFNITIGLIFLLFLPGFLLSLILFSKKELKIVERMILSITLSIAISIGLGIILFWSKAFLDLLGLSKFNLYSGLIIINLFFLVILIYQKFKKQPHK